jgi:hypothetical protein
MVLPLAAAALALSTALLTAGQSAAAAPPADKAAVLSGFTQPTQAGYAAWLAADTNQGAWSAYGFDWSTDYCSTSPDNPFGFPFKTACARHDFGYRNYKAAGTFDANKARLDTMLYTDLKQVCAGYGGATKTSCDATAWTYYHAVDIFGATPAVDGARTAP